MLKLIVGLGNPGEKYAKTRHNVGYQVLDTLKKHQDQLGKVEIFKSGVFMNVSGQPVAKKIRKEGIRPSEILVILDDMDLGVGKIRVRLSGSSAGHLGMESVIKELGTEEIPRLRLGIGRPPQSMHPNTYVIQNFSKDEAKIIKQAIDKAVALVLQFIEQGEIKEVSLDVKS